jgi:Domain of unknown function (DUF4270)
MSTSFLRLLGTALLLAWVASGCNTPANFGSDFAQGPGITRFAFPSPSSRTVPFSILRTDPVSGDPTDANGSLVGEVLLGNYRDAALGSVSASPFVSFYNVTQSNFGTQVDLDSVVLVMRFTGAYGDFTQPIAIEAYEIADTLSFSLAATGTPGYSRTYTTDDSVAVDRSRELLGGVQLAFSDTGTVRTLRAKLPLDIARRLIDRGNGILGFTPDTLQAFNKLFRGLYFTSRPVQAGLVGAVHSLNLQAGQTRIEIFIRSNDPNNNNERRSRTLTLAPTIFGGLPTPYFTRIRRSNTGSDLVGRWSARPNAPLGDTLTGVQGGVQLKTVLRLPSLASLPPGSVNDARLTLYVDPAYFDRDSVLQPPPRLWLHPAKADSLTEDFSVDFLSTSARYNGLTRSYTFPIRNYVQYIKTGRAPDFGLVLVAAERHTRLSRVVLAGRLHPTAGLRPSFSIFYTVSP